MSDSPLTVSAISDRYRIQREIGHGGMAVVYLADDLRHHRAVAIKLLHAGLAHAVGPERFLREIEIAARLTHPHIVPLFDSGEVDGRLFYVMPFLDGESLRQRLDRERVLPVPDAIGIARQVASALEYAHARGVVHRDIKPENILLYENEAMVADFGIALALSAAATPRITGTGLVVGTPEYMSPEQALDEGADARSDQYSLACVLFEMLAGEAPYAGATPYSILSKRLVDPVPSVRRLRDTVPPVVDRAIVRALARCRHAGRRHCRVGRAAPRRVRRRAPVPQPQRRSGERVLRRRHHRRRHRPSLEDSRPHRHLAELGDAVQAADGEHAGHQRHARRDDAARRQRAARRQSRPHRRPAR